MQTTHLHGYARITLSGNRMTSDVRGLPHAGESASWLAGLTDSARTRIMAAVPPSALLSFPGSACRTVHMSNSDEYPGVSEPPDEDG